MSLQNVIVQQDASTLDHASKQKLERHLQKLCKAIQTGFATSAIQSDHIQFLLKINNEAKARRATRAIVLGKARVMSYADLEAARSQRAEKDAAKERKRSSFRRQKGEPLGSHSQNQGEEILFRVAELASGSGITQWSTDEFGEAPPFVCRLLAESAVDSLTVRSLTSAVRGRKAARPRVDSFLLSRH